MTFLLYKTASLSDHQVRYTRLNEVTLAGGGLIQTTCRKSLKGQNVGWTFTAAEMLETGGYNPLCHALVIDAAPNRKAYLLLMEIVSISGYSYPEWTPLMVKLNQLFADDWDEATVEATKSQFDDEVCSRNPVREFLYLLGGHSTGGWNWGGNSRTTAALLWDDAWDFFRQIP